jgi:starch synthase
VSCRAGRQGIDLLVLEADHLFGRDGTPYLGPDGEDWDDNPERFAALSWIAARIAEEGVRTARERGWRPDILHGHDWQAGFAPYYLKKRGSPCPASSPSTTSPSTAARRPGRLAALRLDRSDFVQDGGFEFWGRIDALKAGLVWADRITTVSPTYARELTRPEFGAGLDGVIRSRAGTSRAS